MYNNRFSNNIGALLKTAVHDPRAMMTSQLRQAGFFRGATFAKALAPVEASEGRETPPEPSNPLREYFEANTEGPGIFKWLHYFEIYDRHLARFVGKDVHIVEVGVYSGGSLGMWRSYLGPRSRITGVDIMPACRQYENEYTKIMIGDQADRSFWKRFRDECPPIDIVIDDGGHLSEQQIATLEELLPHVRPGGVYICEDIHGLQRNFSSVVNGLDNALNAYELEPPKGFDNPIIVGATPFQSRIHSIHHYPFIIVIETHEHPIHKLQAVRRGTQWQPLPG